MKKLDMLLWGLLVVAMVIVGLATDKRAKASSYSPNHPRSCCAPVR